VFLHHLNAALVQGKIFYAVSSVPAPAPSLLKSRQICLKQKKLINGFRYFNFSTFRSTFRSVEAGAGEVGYGAALRYGPTKQCGSLRLQLRLSNTADPVLSNLGIFCQSSLR
jgi:hypothetical protein